MGEGHLRLFRSIINLTVLSCFFYPIVWILAEGTGVLCANAEAICYTVLDIISKTVFGFLIVNHPWQVMAEGALAEAETGARCCKKLAALICAILKRYNKPHL